MQKYYYHRIRHKGVERLNTNGKAGKSYLNLTIT